MCSTLPQWSPVTRTGKTREGLEHVGNAKPAAMEPGHEDRENWVITDDRHVLDVAAMEPGHEDRENPRRFRTRRQCETCRNGARSRGPGKPVLGAPTGLVRISRNGARSRGPGKPVLFTEDMLKPKLPQWSPVTRTGKTYLSYCGGMPMWRPQWSPVTRTGKTRRWRWPTAVESCRNGARSRGPGKRRS